MRKQGDGAQGRIRTTDTRIFSPLLYQLSYLGDCDQKLNDRKTLLLASDSLIVQPISN
jgi:hypothetical protein